MRTATLLCLTLLTVVISPLMGSQHSPLQRLALGLLVSLTLALSAYLFAAILRPERF
jgi:K+-transporting ATPase KdpF subunit